VPGLIRPVTLDDLSRETCTNYAREYAACESDDQRRELLVATARRLGLLLNPAARATLEILERLGDEGRRRLLSEVIWQLFGDSDDHGQPVLVPGRVPERGEMATLLKSLRAECFTGGGS